MPWFVLALGVVATIATFGLHATMIGLAVASAEAVISRGFARKGLIRKILVVQGVVVLLMISHLLQVGIWAVLFIDRGEFTDLEPAFYHSATNYTSLGYGDVVMSPANRLLGPLEAVAGMLMFGLSTAVMFAGMTRLSEDENHAETGDSRRGSFER